MAVSVLAQPGRVIQPDAGDYADRGARNNIGRIPATAHAAFNDRHINGFFGKIEKRQRGHEFKIGEMKMQFFVRAQSKRRRKRQTRHREWDGH